MANWDTPQEVIVTGLDDQIIDKTQITDVTVEIDSQGSDQDFAAVEQQNVQVSILDDEPDRDDDFIPDEEDPCPDDPDCDDDTISDGDEPAPECITNPDCDGDNIGDQNNQRKNV